MLLGGEYKYTLTGVTIVAVVMSVLSGTASGAVTAVGVGVGVTSVALFSFSSSTPPPMMIVAPGTLSASLDDACRADLSVCGRRVTDVLGTDKRGERGTRKKDINNGELVMVTLLYTFLYGCDCSAC